MKVLKSCMCDSLFQACAKENERVKKKEQRKRDFELQVQRLEQAVAKEEKKKSAKEKAAEKAKAAAVRLLVCLFVFFKYRRASFVSSTLAPNRIVGHTENLVRTVSK